MSAWYVSARAFPRVAALSEAVWSQPASMSWAVPRRLPPDAALSPQGIAAPIRICGGLPARRWAHGGLSCPHGCCDARNQTAFGQSAIRSMAPSQRRNRSSTPGAVLELGTVIKAAAFSQDGRLLAATRSYDFNADTLLTRSSNELQAVRWRSGITRPIDT